jgi:hypothetical protein
MCDPQHLTALWASTACYRDSFILLFTFAGQKPSGDFSVFGRIGVGVGRIALLLTVGSEILMLELRRLYDELALQRVIG